MNKTDREKETRRYGEGGKGRNRDVKVRRPFPQEERRQPCTMNVQGRQ